MGYTQKIRSKGLGTDSEEKHIAAREYAGGKHYCDVNTILQELSIEHHSANLLFQVDDMETAEFVHHNNKTDFTRLKFYAGQTIVVSKNPHGSKRRSPLLSQPLRQSFLNTDPHAPKQPREPAVVDDEDGAHNAQKGEKSKKSSLWHMEEKSQTVICSGKKDRIKAHSSHLGGYHCHVSEIVTKFGLDTTGATIYKYRVGGIDVEFQRDKQNRIDITKKIKSFPEEIIEILEVPSVSSPALSDVTMIADRTPNRRRESAGADSQATANVGHDNNSLADSHEDSPPERDFRDLLANYRQCACSRNLHDVNLSLTGAPMARKVFEALAGLKCVRKLNVTLAWNFRKSDLSAMVKSLNQSSVKHLILDLKDKKSWKRPKFKFLFGRKYEPLQDLYRNPNLLTFHLVGASRFGIRTNPLPALPSTKLTHLHLRIRLDGKSDQAAAQSIIKNCPQLVDLRLGGIYESQMHGALKSTIGELERLEVFHLYGMQKNEHGGPILDLLGGVTSSGNKLKELVLVNSNMDAVEIQALIKKCERTLTTIVLDHATFQPPNLKFLGTIPPDRPLLQNLTSLHLHVCENLEGLQLLGRTLKQLSLTHLGLTQGDPKVVQDLLGGKSLLQNVNFGSLHSLFLSGFHGPSLAPLWEAVGTTTGSESSIDLGRLRTVGRTSLQYLSLEHLSKCYDLSSQLRRLRLESLWVVADVQELGCELNQLAMSLDYSSLKKVALFRTGELRGPSLGSYFGKLESHLQTSVASNLTIRVGDFKKGWKGSHDELSKLKVLSYIVDNRGAVTRGPSESVCKYHNPRYHRYRWDMTGWGEAGGDQFAFE
ncbi:hypothetical protein BGZ67_002670 [Mortierella alpina]|nr:hypothetical protein BGZ67_002670 [Mortierella alpina]